MWRRSHSTCSGVCAESICLMTSCRRMSSTWLRTSTDDAARVQQFSSVSWQEPDLSSILEHRLPRQLRFRPLR